MAGEVVEVCEPAGEIGFGEIRIAVVGEGAGAPEDQPLELRRVVPGSQAGPIDLRRVGWLAPQPGHERGYALLARLLEHEGWVARAHDRQGRALTLRSVAGVLGADGRGSGDQRPRVLAARRLAGVVVGDDELGLARRLAAALSMGAAVPARSGGQVVPLRTGGPRPAPEVAAQRRARAVARVRTRPVGAGWNARPG